MPSPCHAAFRLARVTDTLVLILDLDDGCSVTNDAEAVVAYLNETLPGGLGWRRLYYRDTTGRFDELVTNAGRFCSYRACTDSQQEGFAKMAGAAMRGLAP